MVLLGHEAQVELHFGPFGDRCTVCAECTIGSENRFGRNPMVLLGDKAEVEAHFGPFGDSANLEADR